MFPHFGATDTLSKASTMVFRIGTDAHLYDDPDDANIASLLDSKFDSEKCEALKRLLALIAQGLDVSNFFPQVVKNVATQSLEVKKLVYVYLLHYAEKRPNEALLSINCFQKDLGDPNPLVRAWALRAMAGIRLHVIAPLVLVAIRKCARDPSVYVRKCAAYALPKLNDLRLEENMFAIEEIVGLLLNDCSPGVVGAAASVFASICPNNFSLIGRNYKRLCEILPDVEEWGQIVLIGILLRFIIAKHGLVKESLMFSLYNSEINSCEGDEPDSKLELNEDTGCATTNDISELAKLIFQCYIERPDEYLSRSSCPVGISPKMNPDQFTSSSNEYVKILLRCTSPLLWSHNSAVVLAAAGVHWIVASRHDIKRIVKPLLFVLRSSKTSKYVVLCNIQVFAKAMPSLFAPHFEDFFISSSDSYQTKALKLDILSSIATESAIPFVLKEFQDYIKDPDRRFAADTIAAIGLCAQRLPKLATTYLQGLLTLIRQDILFTDVGTMDGEAGVLVQAIVTIKSIIKLDPPQHEKVIVHLVCSLDSIKVPAARAIVIWMVGEYSSLGDVLPRMLTTILKYLAWCFPSEALEAKLQILNMVTKVLLRTKGEDRLTIKMVLNYTLELAEYDLNYDIRDRARVLKILLSSYLGSPELNDGSSALQNEDLSYAVAEVLFVGQRRASKVSVEPMIDRCYLPGSLSQIVLHAAPGYEALPKPCSVPLDDLTHLDGAVNSDLTKDGDPDSLSGSSDEENASDYSSQQSYSGSSVSGSADGVGSASDNEKNTDPLIQIADVGSGSENRNDMPQSGSADFGDLVSRRALESWLDEEPDSKASTFQVSQARSTARITIGDISIKIKHYPLLDPANGSGLKVDYSFSSEASSISPHLVCIEVLFENCSSEPMSDVLIVNEDSTKDSDCGDQTSITESSSKSHSDAPNVVSMEPILCLQPGQRVNRMLQVHFHHHLLPLKLVLFCNGKKFPVKIRPDIGYFVKPLPMDLEAFRQRESSLRGMFEYTRSCTFTDHLRELNKDNSSMTNDQFLVICQSLAQKMLSNGNLFLVSVDMPVINNLDDASGLCLRFSSEIMSNTSPCLITLTVEGKCSDPLNVSVKVNCEETVFGLNLLNRIVSFLLESSSAQS